jgi:hypothetical protein
MSYLNPILLAVKCRSFDCFTYLVNTFGIRQSARAYDISVRVGDRDLPFKSILMPLILKGKDNDILSFLLKTDGFVFSSSDFNSFVAQAISERWT